MALLFITALLMSADIRQSQSSRKFAWTELHLSWSWWEAEGVPVHCLTLQPKGMVQPALPHWGIWALSCSTEQTHPNVALNSYKGTQTIVWKCRFPVKIPNNTSEHCSDYTVYIKIRYISLHYYSSTEPSIRGLKVTMQQYSFNHSRLNTHRV